MVRWVVALGGACVLAAAMAACGGGSDKPAAVTPGVSDEEYLKVICSGTQGFSDALISQTTVDGIAKSIKDFIAAMNAVTPPSDLQAFHKDLLKYLDDSLKDPTSAVTRKRPQPPDKARQRLAAKEPSVPECSKVHYFQTN